MQHAASFERGDQHVFQPRAADVDVAVRDGGLDGGREQIQKRQNLGQRFVFVGGVGYPVQL